jgi:lupus La protein
VWLSKLVLGSFLSDAHTHIHTHTCTCPSLHPRATARSSALLCYTLWRTLALFRHKPLHSSTSHLYHSSLHCFSFCTVNGFLQFYFGDSNLTKPDKFLLGKIKESEEGWVDLSVIGSFTRMKQLVPSGDVQELATTLRTSSNDLLEISEDGANVRRSATCPLPKESLYNKRTLYTKGWDLEGTSIDSVDTYFTEKGFKVLSTRLRYAFGTKEFKGSVFIELEDVDAAVKACGEKFAVGENTLGVEMKDAYHTRKKAERAEKKGKKAGAGGEKKAEEEEEPEEEFVAGCILGFKGVPDDTSREDFKEAFGKYAEVSWVDFQRGDTSGEVRFAGADAATVLAKCVEEEVKINGVVPELAVLDGEQELVSVCVHLCTCVFSSRSKFLLPEGTNALFQGWRRVFAVQYDDL